MPRSLFIVATFLFSFLTPSHGQFELGEGLAKADTTVASLHSEVSAIAPGRPFTVGLKLAHPPGWHSYYKNTGGVSNPPKVTWTLPKGNIEASLILKLA